MKNESLNNNLEKKFRLTTECINSYFKSLKEKYLIEPPPPRCQILICKNSTFNFLRLQT